MTTVIAPAGCVVNPTPPTACSTGGNSETSMRLADMLLMVMSQAAPKHVIAGSYASASVVVFSGPDPDEERRAMFNRDRTITVEVHAGGFGARPDKDGVNGLRVHGGNVMTITVEYMEFTTPIRVLEWSIVPDTGGAGRWRGGAGTRRVYEALADGMLVTFTGERAKIGAYGLFGGRPGAVAQAFFERAGSGRVEPLRPKGPPFMMNRGDRLTIITGGGGGYGDPRERDPALVAQDVENGYVSSAEARRWYGWHREVVP